MGKTLDDFRHDYRDHAETQIKNSIVLDKIAKVENVEASDEMVDEHMKQLADSYGMNYEKFKSAYGSDEDRQKMKKDLKYPAVFKFLYDNAVFE